MFKRKSQQVSPLAPPPASTSPASSQNARGMGGNPQYHPQQQQFSHPQGPVPGTRQSSSGTSGPGVAQAHQQDLQRMSTNGTMGDTGSVNSKADKRRSGFFGFGKKDKDKKEDKFTVVEEEKLRPTSFSVDRPTNRQPQSQMQPPNGQHFPGMDRLPSQQSISTPRPPGAFPTGENYFAHEQHNPQQRQGSPGSFAPSQAVQGSRIVSSPQVPSADTANRDFGPYPGHPAHGVFPKSQSMGFAQQQRNDRQSPPVQGNNQPTGYGGLPGNMVDQRRDNTRSPPQQIQGGMNRSQSMPFDQQVQQQQRQQSPMQNGANAPSTATPPPPAEKDVRPAGSPNVTPARQTLGSPGPGSPANGTSPSDAWKRRFDGIVDLIAVQPQKTYVASPPELEMILARTSAGGQPKQGQPGSISNDWDSVWLQLSGISLSMWSMKETRAAAAKGEKVPPTYFNITDSSLELLAPLPPPPHRPNSHPHHYVFSLNTAGSNRLLFSCPTERDLSRWATGLRLAAWERSRLEEIYTGHLIKTNGKEPGTALVKGRMEGWVRVRVMGGTDWKRLWLVLSRPVSEEKEEDVKKSRRRSFFGLGDASKEKEKEVVQEPNTGISMASFYLEPRTPKNKTSVAVLTISAVTQAYAVFPERLDVMSQSNLMKVVGRIGGEVVTIEGRLRDSGWALIMPDQPEVVPGGPAVSPLNNMMRWVTGFHDVFGLYGRPERYAWDPMDPRSLFFAYPQGQDRNRLFLDIEDAIVADFRTSTLPAVRTQFKDIVKQRLSQPRPAEVYRGESDNDKSPAPRVDGSYRLPPLSFGNDNAPSPQLSHEGSQPRSLTPITEKTDIDLASRTNSTRTAKSNFLFSENRRLSDQTIPTKQNSGGSLRPSQGGANEDRLAPISDSSEQLGQYPDDTYTARKNSLLNETPTTMESATDWSRSTGASPTLDDRSPTKPVAPRANIGASAPVTAAAAIVATKVASDLPDLPAAKPVAASNRDVKSANPAPAAAVSNNTAKPSQIVSSPTTIEPSTQDRALLSPKPVRGPAADPQDVIAIHDEPAAMYLMNMVDAPSNPQPAQAQPSQPRASGLSPPNQTGRTISPDRSRPTIITNFEGPRPTSSDSLGRKPSGARGMPVKKSSSTASGPGLDTIGDENGSPPSQHAQVASAGVPNKTDTVQPRTRLASSATQPDLGEDAANFVAYAESPSPAKPTAQPVKQPLPPKPKDEEELRSSFAPSKAAAERQAKAEATAAEQQRAKQLPGGGKRTGPTTATWSGSDDEEDEDEDEVHSPAEKATPSFPRDQADRHPQRVVSQTRALPPLPRGSMSQQGDPPRESAEPTYSTFSKAGYENDRVQSRSPQRRQPLDQGRQAPLQPPLPPLSHQPQPQANVQRRSSPAQQMQTPQNQNRQTIWNSNFTAEHGMDTQKSGKFVELDEPSAHLTKAFAPHGLLQAGLQDKEDRSAKKQEEFAREMGSSLINVPNKPPPPQTGLLGAVAQHEQERKNAGGIGATITDREREKRVMEERQRDGDRYPKQQMDQMRQYPPGDMGMGYGQYPMMNMGMMGMPPMSYPYQGGYNPYAQQQAMMAAQMAYHQAMMMSQHGGSQYGGGPGGGVGGSQSGHRSPERPSSPSDHQGPGSSLGHHAMNASPGPGMGPYGAYPYSPPPPASMYGWPPPGMSPMWHSGSPAPGSQGFGSPAPPSMPWLHPNANGSGSVSDHHGGDGASRSRVTSYASDNGNGQKDGQHAAS